jgi:hypothetical protein
MTMAWILALALTLLIAVMIRAFLINAIAMKRDIDKRFDDLRVRLEHEATSTIEPFLYSSLDAQVEERAFERRHAVRR